MSHPPVPDLMPRVNVARWIPIVRAASRLAAELRRRREEAGRLAYSESAHVDKAREAIERADVRFATEHERADRWVSAINQHWHDPGANPYATMPQPVVTREQLLERGKDGAWMLDGIEKLEDRGWTADSIVDVLARPEPGTGPDGVRAGAIAALTEAGRRHDAGHAGWKVTSVPPLAEGEGILLTGRDADGNTVRLWARDASTAEEIRQTFTHGTEADLIALARTAGMASDLEAIPAKYRAASEPAARAAREVGAARPGPEPASAGRVVGREQLKRALREQLGAQHGGAAAGCAAFPALHRAVKARADAGEDLNDTLRLLSTARLDTATRPGALAAHVLNKAPAPVPGETTDSQETTGPVTAERASSGPEATPDAASARVPSHLGQVRSEADVRVWFDQLDPDSTWDQRAARIARGNYGPEIDRALDKKFGTGPRAAEAVTAAAATSIVGDRAERGEHLDQAAALTEEAGHRAAARAGARAAARPAPKPADRAPAPKPTTARSPRM